MATTINAATTGLIETSDGTAVLALQTGGTTAVTINATQALGVGSSPSYGTAGQFLTSGGSGAAPTWTSGGSGTVTSVGWTGGIVSVATATTTPAFTIAGTSGGIPYFDSASTWATSAVLAANSLVKGGGAGVAPSTITTGTGVLTALGNNVSGSSGIALVTQPQFTNTIGVGAAAAASGSGVTFAASQSSSSDINTLDDYEEGVVVPRIAFGGGTTGITYDVGTGGYYTKIGRFVHVVATIALTNKGSSTGAATITGLPFTSASPSDNNSVATYKVDNITFTGVFENVMANSATTINLQQVTTAGTRSNLDNTNFSNTSTIVLSLSYITAT